MSPFSKGKEFKSSAPLDTPIARARAEWDERMGAPTVHAYFWRLVSFLLLIPLSISIAGNIYLAGEPKANPVYIAIDSLGQAGVLTKLEVQPKADDGAIAYHLRSFIEWMRRVSADPALTTDGWRRSYWFATSRGQQMLTAQLGPYLTSDPQRIIANAAKLAEKGTVAVDVQQPLKITDGSWQVDWKEQLWDPSGRLVKSTKWRGTFHIRMKPPATRNDAIQNPIGMYVDELNWVELQ